MATGLTEVTQSPETGDTLEECAGKQVVCECIADLEVRIYFLHGQASVVTWFAVLFWVS